MSRSRGFSLPGVLVAAAIFSIMTAAVVTLFSQMLGGQNYLKFRAEVENFHEEVRSLLSSKQACLQTFGGRVLIPTANYNIPALLDTSGNPIYSAGQVYGDRSFRITSMTLGNYQDRPDPGQGTAVLTLQYTAAAELTGPRDLVRTITVATMKNISNNQLTECIALSKMSDGIWSYVPGTTWDITFNAGNVGIGSAIPTSKLDLIGNINVQGQLSTSVFNAGAGNQIDWSQGNVATTSSDCSAPVDFNNLRNGGTYTLVVTSNSVTACTFSTATIGIDAATVTYRFRPPNAARTAATHSVYTLMRVGTIVYVSWASGF